MEHVKIYIRLGNPFHFWSSYNSAILRLHQLLDETPDGNLEREEMSMDAGDMDIIFSGSSAEALYATILPVLKELPFLRGAIVSFIFGPIDSGSPERKFELQF